MLWPGYNGPYNMDISKISYESHHQIVHLTVENDLWPHEILIFYFTSYLYHQNKSVDSLGFISSEFLVFLLTDSLQQTIFDYAQ